MDYRERFISDVVRQIATLTNGNDIEVIQGIIVRALNDYELSERCTQIVVRSADQNEQLLKSYYGCLMVDGKSKKTIAAYKRQLERLSDALQKPFTEVGTYDLRYYLACIKENGASSSTLEIYRSYFSAFFQWMLREEIIDKDPCAKIKPIKCEKVVLYPFSETDIDSLRSGCTCQRDRAIIEVLVSSGIRVSELCALEISDIDFTSLSVHVRCGKGGKERITYISDVAAKHLKKYLLSRSDSLTYLFKTLRGNEMLNANSVEKMLKKLGKRAGVDNVHPHRFRRTFATKLSKSGVDVQTIARLMGHSNIQTTLTYVYLDDTQIANAYRMHTA